MDRNQVDEVKNINAKRYPFKGFLEFFDHLIAKSITSKGDISFVGNLIKNGIPFEGGVTGDTVPIGTIMLWGSDIIPDNWIAFKGQAISRTIYSELFALYGTTYGAGDGVNTFNVPDMRDKVPVGKSDTDTNINAFGKIYGSKTHTLTVGQVPAHGHTGTTAWQGDHSHSVSVAITGGSDAGNWDRLTLNGWGASRWWGNSAISGNAGGHNHSFTTNNTGDGTAHNNMQPSMVWNFIVKAKQSAGIVATVVDGFSSTSAINAGSAKNDKILYEMHNNEVWQIPTFQNGWINYGSGFQTAGFYKHDGRVYLRGMVKNGTKGVAIFTLPTGYRPTATELFAVDSSDAHGRLNISADGVVALITGSNVWASLSGISFRID